MNSSGFRLVSRSLSSVSKIFQYSNRLLKDLIYKKVFIQYVLLHFQMFWFAVIHVLQAVYVGHLHTLPIAFNTLSSQFHFYLWSIFIFKWCVYKSMWKFFWSRWLLSWFLGFSKNLHFLTKMSLFSNFWVGLCGTYNRKLLAALPLILIIMGFYRGMTVM